MTRFSICLAIALIATSVVGAARDQQTPPVPSQSPLLTSSPTLQTALARIAHRSASWRQAMAAVAGRGGRILVFTSEQVVVADGAGTSTPGTFDSAVLAEVAPVPRPDNRVDAVLVVVNLTLLEAAHQRHQTLPAEFAADLERILVHEIYAHAVPYLLAGHVSGRCADPQPGERAIDACSIQRENVVRGELGLNRRTDYGLHDLHVMRVLRR